MIALNPSIQRLIKNIQYAYNAFLRAKESLKYNRFYSINFALKLEKFLKKKRTILKLLIIKYFIKKKKGSLHNRVLNLNINLNATCIIRSALKRQILMKKNKK